MKIYYYNEPDGHDNNVVVRMTSEDILNEYWNFWLEKMTQKYGAGHKLITEQNCIEDWVATHYAWIEEYEIPALPNGDLLIVESLDDLDDEPK